MLTVRYLKTTENTQVLVEKPITQIPQQRHLFVEKDQAKVVDKIA